MAFRRYFAVPAITLAFAAFSLTVQSAQAQKKETFKALLSATPADARTRASLAGSGTASGVLEGSKLEITGSFKGLLAPATKASSLGETPATCASRRASGRGARQ